MNLLDIVFDVFSNFLVALNPIINPNKELNNQTINKLDMDQARFYFQLMTHYNVSSGLVFFSFF